jgi:hypothetical protein
VLRILKTSQGVRPVETIVFCPRVAHSLRVPSTFAASTVLAAFFGLLPWCCQSESETSHSPALPAEITLNQSAGRGGWVILSVRLAEGEELPMILDTGAPITLVDLSLRPKLGERLDLGTVESFHGRQLGGVYAAPKFYLDQVPLEGGSNVVATDLNRLLPPMQPRIVGILGMDCLRHYCVQLDFEAGKLRFLGTNDLNATNLGQGFPLCFATDALHLGIPIIHQPGLLGGAPTNTVIDTGNDSDGTTKRSAIRRHAAGSYTGGFVRRFKHFLAVEGLVSHGVLLPDCAWAGNNYTNLAIDRGHGEYPNWIGIRFLARHLVTLDFPDQMLYLRQTSRGPLAPKEQNSTPTQKEAAKKG